MLFKSQELIDLINKYCQSDKVEFTRVVNWANNRLNDPNVYLGIVGVFSSGKSTLINALIRRNVLQTDVVQGTTTSTAIIRNTEKWDLIVHYIDGENISYKDNKKQLEERYESVIPVNRVSLFKQILNWIKNLFGYGVKLETEDECILRYFNTLSTNEECSLDIESLELCVKKVENTRSIVFVDMPGVEALNKRHMEVAISAVEKYCDSILIATPADKGMPQSFINFLKNRWETYLPNSCVVVTKVDSIRNETEIERNRKALEKRLNSNLGIAKENVFYMPTLIFLEESQIYEKSTLFDHFSTEYKAKLVKMFTENESMLFQTIEKIRAKCIEDKIRYIITRVRESCARAIDNLKISIQNDINKSNQQIKPNIEDFLSRWLKEINEERNNKKEFIANECKKICEDMIQSLTYMRNNISSSSYEISDVVERISQEIEKGFLNANNRFIQQSEEAYQRYIDLLKKYHEDFSKEFHNEYSLPILPYQGIDKTMIKAGLPIDDFIDYNMLVNEISQLLKKKTSGILNSIVRFFSNNDDEIIQEIKNISTERLAEGINKYNTNLMAQTRENFFVLDQTSEASYQTYVVTYSEYIKNENKNMEAHIDELKHNEDEIHRDKDLLDSIIIQ